MNILYTCDDAYVWLMGISMFSLLDNNKNIDELNVYLIGENISYKNRYILKNIAKEYNRSLFIINAPKETLFEGLLSARWPSSAFLRLFAGEILPKTVERVLYLDCDTIVVGNLSLLEHQPFHQKMILGVKDCISGRYKKNIGLQPQDVYINAGVLLMNVSALRQLDIRNQLKEYLFQYQNQIHYADQDILNGMFRGKIGVLKANYNVMTIMAMYSPEEIKRLRRPVNYYESTELKMAVSSPVIIHYTTNMRSIRPWYQKSKHPFLEPFLYYKNRTIWKEKKAETMRFSGIELRIIGLIEYLPQKLSQWLLGFLHAFLKPWIVAGKAQLKQRGRLRKWKTI